MTGLPPAGFPHSDIPGSLLMCSSPRLFAAYHVFLRLSVPRHPPCALSCLTFCKQSALLNEVCCFPDLFRHSVTYLRSFVVFDNCPLKCSALFAVGHSSYTCPLPASSMCKHILPLLRPCAVLKVFYLSFACLDLVKNDLSFLIDVCFSVFGFQGTNTGFRRCASVGSL